ncbi:hypothetical protein BDY24DRAFT_165351 [Mrakia frigida]|uniref:uncharacterized protein n=1 Tax=Mrakia frigida TaxID=29902 RepID=UPI003FCC11C7
MNSSNLFPPRSPPRKLPWDVLLLVFKLSDRATLAKLGRVSLDFLAASSPHLYRDIKVTSVEELLRMFCQRKRSTHQSRINSYLSLSTLRSLNVDFSALKIPIGLPPPLLRSLDFSRLLDPHSLPLDLLRFDWLISSPLHFYYMHSSLLPILNPRRIDFKMHQDRQSPTFRPSPFWESSFAIESWTRLEVVDLWGAIPVTSNPNQSETLLLGVPARTLLGLKRMRLHIASLVGWEGHPATALEVVKELEVHENSREMRSNRLGLSRMRDGSVVIVVESEEERRAVEDAFAVALHDLRRSLFSIVVEPRNRHLARPRSKTQHSRPHGALQLSELMEEASTPRTGCVPFAVQAGANNPPFRSGTPTIY